VWRIEMADKTSVAKGRREVLRKAAYLAPLIVTLPVLPSFASAGSRSAVRDGMATLNPLAVHIIGQLSSLDI